MNCVKTSLKQERLHPVKINIVATELTRAKKKKQKRALSS